MVAIWLVALPIFYLWLTAAAPASSTTEKVRRLQSAAATNASLEDADLSNFSSAVAGVVAILGAESGVTASTRTVFAPTDGALARGIGLAFLAQLEEPSWILHLQNLIEGHLTENGPVRLSGFQNGQEIVLRNGETVTIEIEGTDIYARSAYNETAALITETGRTTEGALVLKLDFILQPFFLATRIQELGPFNPDFSLVFFLLENIGLTEGLDILPEGVYTTILAPTNDAFVAKFGQNAPALLLDPANSATAQIILLNHVVVEVYPTVLMETGDVLATVGGSRLRVTRNEGNGTIELGQATIVSENVLARNGIAHAIDQVLGDYEPPSGSSNPSSLTSTATTPTAAPADDESPVTIPDDGYSFESDPDLEIFRQDLNASGAKDQYLTPVASFSAFAPINAAFERFELMETLRMPSWIAHYRHLMLLHTVVGELSSVSLRDLDNNTQIPTLSGETVTLSFEDAEDGVIYLTTELSKNVTVLGSFQEKDGGNTFHKIDGVLLPEFVGINLLDLTSRVENFSILTELLDRVNIPGGFLEGQYTIFAPTDDAFFALEEDYYNRLRDPDNKTELQAFMLGHVFDGLKPSELFESGKILTSFGGSKVTVGDDLQFFDEAGVSQIILPDVLANNGLAHGIDRALGSPGGVSSLGDRLRLDPEINIFSSALDDSLEPELLNELLFRGTVFAPINSAFTTLGEDLLSRLFMPQWYAHLQNLLTHHIVPGRILARKQLIDTDTITMANGDAVIVEVDGDDLSICSSTQCSLTLTLGASPDGVIYTVDTLLLPDWLNAGIGSVGNSTQNVTMFMDIVERAGFMSGDTGAEVSSVFTILIPSDGAFRALGSDTLDYLRNRASQEDLSALISNHLLNRVYPSRALEDGINLFSLGDLPISVAKSDDGLNLSFNGAAVIKENILFRDGVGHVINRVLGAPQSSAPVAVPVSPPHTTLSTSKVDSPRKDGSKLMLLAGVALAAALL